MVEKTLLFEANDEPKIPHLKDVEVTNLLVSDLPQGESLSRTLGDRSIALMRGHGCVVVSRDVTQLVMMCIAMDRNAQVLLAASQFGEVHRLSKGEITKTGERPNGDNRGWEYYRRRAAVADRRDKG